MEKTPIRIAQIIGKWVGGGVEAVVMNYYRNIDKTKIQFDFICDNDSTNIPYQEIEQLGGKVILIPPYQHQKSYQKELQKILKQNNYKIIHSHINTMSVFPLYAAKKVGIPIRIAHSHSTSNKVEWKKNILKNILRPYSKIYATDYFCCSELAGKYLFGNKTYNEGKVFLLNNAIDLDKYKYNEKERNKQRKKLNINKDAIAIGHIGRFVKQKNHSLLIDIFKKINELNNNTILILVGQGPLENEIKSKVKKLNLDNKVIFLGQLEETNNIYQAFDIFLLPSLYEGLGMVLIEAQVSGLPCIASKEVPTIAKVTNNLHFIDLNNLEEWTNYISKLEIKERNNYLKEIRNNGYDIKIESKKLELKYLEYLKKIGDKNE